MTLLIHDRAVTPRRYHRGFWLITFAFTVAMAFSAVPTPLYVLYQRKDGFGSFVLTLIFAVYALGVLVSLLFAGHVSDWTGRRQVLVPALVLNVLAGVLFLTWDSLAALLVARFISGLGIGMVTATATAHLAELHRGARPDASGTRAQLVSTAANLGGIGLGPLVAGLLAQYAPDPLRTPYVVFAMLMLLGVLGIVLTPETVPAPEEPVAYRPQRISVPAAARGRYFSAGAAALAAFAVFGLFTSLTPSFLADVLRQHSHALAGVAAFSVFGAAAVTQLVFARWGLRTQLGTGLGLLAAGLIVVTAAVWSANLTLFFAGALLAGAGAGATFRGCTAIVQAIAPPESRGEALAGLFVAAYIGLTVPVLAVGLAMRFVTITVAMTGFAAALLFVLAAVSRRLLALA